MVALLPVFIFDLALSFLPSSTRTNLYLAFLLRRLDCTDSSTNNNNNNDTEFKQSRDKQRIRTQRRWWFHVISDTSCLSVVWPLRAELNFNSESLLFCSLLFTSWCFVGSFVRFRDQKAGGGEGVASGVKAPRAVKLGSSHHTGSPVTCGRV